MMPRILSVIAMLTVFTLPLGAWAQSAREGGSSARSVGGTTPVADEDALISSDGEAGEAARSDAGGSLGSQQGGVNFAERSGSPADDPRYSTLLFGRDLQFVVRSGGGTNSPDPATAVTNGALDGEQAARTQSTAVWWLAGAGGGCLLGGIGCLGVTAVGGLTEPGVDFSNASDQGYSEPSRRAYRQAYRDAYTRKMKARRALHAFLGGAISTAVALGALTALLVASS